MRSSDNITLGFGGWNYPYLYRGPSGLPVGFMADNSSGIECDGVLLAIQQGRILTSADGSSLTGFRPRLFHISAPVYYTAFEFFEADRGGEIASADLVFFTVFSIPALCLLLALHFIASFVQFLSGILEAANDNRDVKSSFRNFSFQDFTVTTQISESGTPLYHGFKSLTGVVYVLGITVTVYYHAAGFRGNAIDFRHGGKTSFSDFITGLRSGGRRLITMEENAFDEQELLTLFGSATPTILNEPDQATLLQRLCDEQNLVAMMERNMIKSMSLLERPCQVDNIAVASGTPGLQNVGVQIMQNYLFARNLTSKRMIEDVNQILLRMYSQERIENLWTKRYLTALRNYEDPLEEDLGVDDDYFMPMSLLRLELLFFITIPGWILSALVFVFEVATAKSPVSRVLRVMATHTKGKIMAVIGDEDTVVGFLLGGVGELNKARKPNYLIVDKNTTVTEIEEAFKTFTSREDIAIILINQHIAEQIRFTVDQHTQSIPAVLEIPSKEAPYDPSKDSILNRARGLFNPEDFR
ncbi:vha-9 [Pristionchus pacificus]|uniref:Vha-9 n=1 Tax=Pristionchus pacificus TaxID=54126 RepID=A0A2A6B7Y7_PRIPA|nr:vha-9 [Pristionchus pacificus]|eukprot:PDM61992.1 vha-9 [Pristionchus pacificus]